MDPSAIKTFFATAFGVVSGKPLDVMHDAHAVPAPHQRGLFRPLQLPLHGPLRLPQFLLPKRAGIPPRTRCVDSVRYGRAAVPAKVPVARLLGVLGRGQRRGEDLVLQLGRVVLRAPVAMTLGLAFAILQPSRLLHKHAIHVFYTMQDGRVEEYGVYVSSRAHRGVWV